MNTVLLIWFGCGTLVVLNDIVVMVISKSVTVGRLIGQLLLLLLGPIGLIVALTAYAFKYSDTPIFKKKDNKDEHEEVSKWEKL